MRHYQRTYGDQVEITWKEPTSFNTIFKPDMYYIARGPNKGWHEVVKEKFNET